MNMIDSRLGYLEFRDCSRQAPSGLVLVSSTRTPRPPAVLVFVPRRAVAALSFAFMASAMPAAMSMATPALIFPTFTPWGLRIKRKFLETATTFPPFSIMPLIAPFMSVTVALPSPSPLLFFSLSGFPLRLPQCFHLPLLFSLPHLSVLFRLPQLSLGLLHECEGIIRTSSRLLSILPCWIRSSPYILRFTINPESCGIRFLNRRARDLGFGDGAGGGICVPRRRSNIL